MGDYRTTMGEDMPLTSKQKRQRRWVWFAGTAALLAIVGLAGLVIQVRRYVRAAGYVTTQHYAEVRPGTVGTVSEITVFSGDTVKKNQVMVRLDSSEEEAALEEARSRVSQIEAEVARRRAEIEEKKRTLKEDIEIAKLKLRDATTKLERTRELSGKGLVAGSSVEDHKLREELARAELTSLLSRDQSIYHKELAVLQQEMAARRDAVSRAEARVRAREVRAPIAGQVLRYEFVIGERVRPESVLYEIFGGEKKVLKLRVGERYANRIAPGQPYEAELTPYGGLKRILFTGTVENLRNVIQADGKRTYRVAYCSFESGGRSVLPGTRAEAKIYYGKSCLWLFLLGLD